MYNLKRGFTGEDVNGRIRPMNSNSRGLFGTGNSSSSGAGINSKMETLPAKKFVSNHLLAAQPNNEFAKLLPYLERVTMTGDDYVYQPGDDINFVYFPESAVISEFQILEDGRTVEIAMTGREGMLGVSAFFNTEHGATNWAQVSVSGSALKINADILKQQINRDGALQTLLYRYISDYISQISQRVICNSHHTLEERFCSWLLMLQDRNKSGNLAITQEQIARFLGVHRPSVTQIAQALRKRKIINYVRGKLFILNRVELEKSACSCYLAIDKEVFDQYLF